MNILHVNNVDLIGNRFNGYDMQAALNAMGIEANIVVMERMGEDTHTFQLADRADEPFLRWRIRECEKKLSLHGTIYPYLFRLMEMSQFKQADVIHYHLLHNYFGALPVFSKITQKKPSVLTIHDPWIFTGHCIYPLNCERWKTGCGHCQNLDLSFPLEKDNTVLQWKIKRSVFSQSQLELIVASKYMQRLAQESPITKEIEHIHLIPFGIDIDLFSSDRNQKEVRKKLGIPEKNYVICFRADPSPYKGFDCIKKMLDLLKPDRPISLIAVGNPGMLTDYQSRYQILDLGWIKDNHFMAELYCACDVFLMPSTAEAFGLMAIEAMASARPVIVCEGTSLPDVTYAPECGIVIPQNDSNALCKNVTRLMLHPEEGRGRGVLGRKLAEKHYRFENYVKRHISLYKDIIKRNYDKRSG